MRVCLVEDGKVADLEPLCLTRPAFALLSETASAAMGRFRGRTDTALVIEGADSSNDRIHSARDTLTHVDVELAVEILRMNVGFVAGALGVA